MKKYKAIYAPGKKSTTNFQGFLRTHTHPHTDAHTHTHTHTLQYTYIHTHTLQYTYIHTHTHTHTYWRYNDLFLYHKLYRQKHSSFYLLNIYLSELCGFCNGVAEDFVLLGYGASSRSNQIPTLRNYVYVGLSREALSGSRREPSRFIQISEGIQNLQRNKDNYSSLR